MNLYYIYTNNNDWNHIVMAQTGEKAIEIMKAKEDSKCLNLYFDPYIPNGTNRGNRKSWINKGYYLNFMQWKKKQVK